MLIKAVFALVLLLVLTLFTIWYERRVVALMQHRKGPNMNGPFGLLQSLADGMKLMFKEDFTPKAAEKVVFMLAPFVMAIPAITAFAVIPIAGVVRIPFTDITTPLQVTDLPVVGAVHRGHRLDRRLRHRAGRLVVRLDLLAARGAALQRPGDQLRGRDGPGPGRGVPLRRLAVDLGDRGRAGRSRRPSFGVPLWYCVQLFPSFVDLPDLDGGGDQPRPVRPARGRGRAGRRLPHRVLLDALRDVLHGRVHEHDHRLGAGHHAVPRWLARPAAVQPGPGSGRRAGGACSGSSLKVLVMLFMFVWLRGTLPRLRYDQFMRFGWSG